MIARRWLMSAVLSVVWLLPAVSRAEDGLRLLDPRPFGYFLGDTLTRKFEINGPDGETLLGGSLPVAGPVNYWLEIRSVESASKSTRNGTRHTITIAYQLFYAAIDPRTLDIPGLAVRLDTGGNQRSVAVPPLPVIISPLREIFPGKERDRATNLLRPDAAAPFAPTAAIRQAALAFLALLIAGLVLLAHHWAWGPFRKRAARPFTRAAADVGSMLKASASRDAYAKALTALHRAFDTYAGHRLFADDLPGFLDKYEEFDSLAESIEDFFEASRRVFFAGDVDSGLKSFPSDRLQTLAANLARQERGAR